MGGGRDVYEERRGREGERSLLKDGGEIEKDEEGKGKEGTVG